MTYLIEAKRTDVDVDRDEAPYAATGKGFAQKNGEDLHMSDDERVIADRRRVLEGDAREAPYAATGKGFAQRADTGEELPESDELYFEGREWDDENDYGRNEW